MRANFPVKFEIGWERILTGRSGIYDAPYINLGIMKLHKYRDSKKGVINDKST